MSVNIKQEQQLIKDISLDEIDIESVKVNKKSRVWTFNINCPGFLSVDNINNIKKYLINKLESDTVVNIIPLININREDFTSDVEAYSHCLYAMLTTRNPELNGYGNLCSFRMDDDHILIDCRGDLNRQVLERLKLNEAMNKYGMICLGIDLRYKMGETIEFKKDDKRVDFDNWEKKRMAEVAEKMQEEASKSSPARKTVEGKKNKYGRRKKVKGLIFGTVYDGEPTAIENLTEGSGKVAVKGKIIALDKRELKESTLVTFTVTDSTSSVKCKHFIKNKDIEKFNEAVKEGSWVGVSGSYSFDHYDKDAVLRFDGIKKIEEIIRMDEASSKRIELHAHTKMSAFDSVASAKDLVKRAIRWGHKAIAITDHGVLQAFPEAFKAAWSHGSDKPDIKVIYGIEAYMINDLLPIIKNPADVSFDDELTVFKIRTDGSSHIHGKIIDITAVKIQGRQITDEFHTMTNGADADADAGNVLMMSEHKNEYDDNENNIIKRFKTFCGSTPLIAHDASFYIR